MLKDIEALATNSALNRELGARGLAYVQREHSLKALCDALEPITPGITPCNIPTPRAA
jgi:hypothetical protein